MSKSCPVVMIAFFSFLIFLSEPTLVYAKSRMIVADGTVVKNVHACEVDGICFLEVQKRDGQVIQIFYGWEWLGEDIDCIADKTMSDRAWSIKSGQVIEARGQLALDGKKIYLCENQKHYLNVIIEK